MRRILFLSVLIFSFSNAFSSHIVGGELIFIKLSNGPATHRIGLNLYFDEINGLPQAEDQIVNLFIFRKSDNVRMASIQVPKIGRKNISYANPLCGNSTLRTLLISYAVDIQMIPAEFDDPQGYYIVWDRCCRNTVIDNIKNPGDVGSLFSIYFPALYQNNKVIVNSSPVFDEIKGDYACLNANFFIDFKATDADGDSLAYTLTTPVTGFSNRNVPNPQALGSSNYPVVSWVDGLSLNNVIPGPTPPTVNPRTGRMSFTANKIGLYVFSVVVSEYRNGIKIGSVSRDFQIKVVDCFEILPPKILVMESKAKVAFKNNEVIRIKKDDPSCFTIKVTDPNFNQLIKITGRAVNSNRQNFTLLPAQFRTRKTNDTLSFEICLEDCFVTDNNRPIQLELIAEDESCPVPLTDTINVYIYREGADNDAPQVTTSLESPYIETIPEKTLQFDVFGEDIDPDSIRLSARGRGFDLADFGFSFPEIGGMGKVKQKFLWKPPCTLTLHDTLAVDFIVTDLRCGFANLSEFTTVYFIVLPTQNNFPYVSTTLPGDTLSIILNSAENPTFSFDVIANDIDSAQISLFGKGRGFDLGAAKMDFLNKIGTREISSSFNWTPDCSILDGRSEKLFTLDFITEDKSCDAARDTATVFLLIKDTASDVALSIPNVVTPNQDGKNDCFSLSTLPPDNCLDQFEELLIYSRWGTIVYQTSDKNANWCPSDSPPGSYFYQIKFLKRSFKGVITLIK